MNLDITKLINQNQNQNNLMNLKKIHQLKCIPIKQVTLIIME